MIIGKNLLNFLIKIITFVNYTIYINYVNKFFFLGFRLNNIKVNLFLVIYNKNHKYFLKMNQIKNQYSSLNLNQNHIEKILNNYNVKYIKLKSQIDLKLDELIKEFLSDILLFLGNFQDDILLKIKSKKLEVSKNEIEFLSKKLKNKEKNEYNLKQEIKYLLNENQLLKNKIKNQRKKVINSNINDEKKENNSLNNNLEKNFSNTNKKNERTKSEFNKVHNQSFNGIIHKKPKEQKINNLKSIFSKTGDIFNGFQLIDNISHLIKKNDKQNLSNFHSGLIFKKMNMYKYMNNCKKEKEKKRYRSEERNIRKLVDDYNEILNEEISELQNEEADLLQLLNKNTEKKN